MIELLTPVRFVGSNNCWDKRPLGARQGIMYHFDDSSSDESGEEWFHDPTCHVSYNRLYLDNGDVVQITPTMEHAAWHAGVCRTANANRFYYGLAIAANERTPVTPKQFESIAHDSAALFLLNHWAIADITRRTTGHEDEATWDKTNAPKTPARWGKLGRKVDPTGLHADRPILSTLALRHRVLELLGGLS